MGGVLEYSSGKWKTAFWKSGPPFHLPPTQRVLRRSCLRSSWINSRSVFVDTGMSNLPPTHKVSPQVLTCVPFGVLQRGLLLTVASV